jgi:hypothetical protein
MKINQINNVSFKGVYYSQETLHNCSMNDRKQIEKLVEGNKKYDYYVNYFSNLEKEAFTVNIVDQNSGKLKKVVRLPEDFFERIKNSYGSYLNYYNWLNPNRKRTDRVGPG